MVSASFSREWGAGENGGEGEGREEDRRGGGDGHAIPGVETIAGREFSPLGSEGGGRWEVWGLPFPSLTGPHRASPWHPPFPLW